MARLGKLIFFCGKMASGKSTRALREAEREAAVLMSQDQLLDDLFPGEILELADYARLSRRLNEAIKPVVVSMLRHGVTVVLDFPANTKSQRAWFREVIDASGAVHELVLLEVDDETCKRRLALRSRDLPHGTPWTTETEFDAVTAYFDPPAPEEGFRVVRSGE